MNIELEMKIHEDEPETKINSRTSLVGRLSYSEKHEVLFSPETSHLYSSTRQEASFSYDYEINNICFGEEKEQAYMYIWQFQIEDITIIGRTWIEFKEFLLL